MRWAPEAELLLRCARCFGGSSTADKTGALLQKDIDWAYLLRLASRHRMVQLLFWYLNSYPEAVPEVTLSELRGHFRENTRRNLLLTRELLKLLGLFDAHGMRAIPYKGPTLAVSVYGNLALRESDDLDILINEPDLPKAKELLASMGYVPEYPLSSAQEVAWLRHHYAQSFWRSEVDSTIEIHWRVVERHFSLPLALEGLGERLEQIHLGDDVVPTLSVEDLLLVLCVHGTKHHWERLRWICDVAELLRVRTDVNWETLMGVAESLGSQRMLSVGLYLAHDLLGAPLPQQALHKVQADPAVMDLANWVYERLFSESNGSSNGLEEDFPFHPFHLRARERLRDKSLYCVRAALTTTIRDWMLLPLPRHMYALYHVVRLIRLTAKYGPRLLKRLIHVRREM